MTTKATHAVVSWRLQGEEPLNPEEVEVCLLGDLIVKTCSKPGGVVQLQFKQVLWEGTILSVHGKKKEAEKALRQAESPKQTPSVPDEGRQRKKKSFGDDFVSEEVSTEASKGKEPASKSAAGKRAPGKSAADKSEAAKIAADKAEKQKERERKRKERELHRNVLSEQNTLLLARMTDADQAVEVDESDNFDSSLVPDCMEILNPDANPSPIVQLQRNHYAQASPPPQPHTSQSLTPLQPSEQHNASTNITPLQATYMQRQPLQTIHNPNPTSTPSRPQFGGKCPRRRQFEIQQDSDQRESGCPDCKRLKQEVQNLKMQLSAYQEHNDQGLPKPGKVLPAIANQFKMIELSPGSGIYVFDKHIEQACARKTPTSCAAFLLNCFYTNTEMAGMNLTGANGKPHPDKQVIESILAFTMKKHPNTSAAVIKASLRNKIAANNSRANKVINH